MSQQVLESSALLLENTQSECDSDSIEDEEIDVKPLVPTGRRLPVSGRGQKPGPIDVGEWRHDPGVNIYVSEITRNYPLLTFGEEQELGRRISDERDLDARNQMVEHNLRLVLWVVCHFHRNAKMAPGDMIAEGNAGLIRAASKFNYRQGYRFATYAIWWIRQAINRAILEQSGAMRVPGYVYDLHRKIVGASRAFKKEYGRTPTDGDIAVLTGLLPEKVNEVRAAIRLRAVSLDAPMVIEMSGKGDRGEAGPLGDILLDKSIPSSEVHVEAIENLKGARRNVEEILGILSELPISARNRNIFRTFYGLENLRRGKRVPDERRTLEETSRMFDLSRERVRQIVAVAWQKMRCSHPTLNHDALIETLDQNEELGKLVTAS